jgi:hypothetical protein
MFSKVYNKNEVLNSGKLPALTKLAGRDLRGA